MGQQVDQPTLAFRFAVTRLHSELINPVYGDAENHPQREGPHWHAYFAVTRLLSELINPVYGDAENHPRRGGLSLAFPFRCYTFAL